MMRTWLAAGLVAGVIAGHSAVLAWGDATPPAEPASAAPAGPVPATPAEPTPAAPAEPAPPVPETAPDPATYREWYYMAGQETAGPFAIGPMRDEVKAGKLVAATLTYVARNGWKPAKDHAELADLFPVAAAPVAPPPPPAPTGPSQADLDLKALTYFMGTWHAEGTGQFQTGETYRVVTEITYLANGILRGVSTYTVPQSSYTGTMGLSGTYTVRATGENLFILSTDILATGAAASDKGTNTYRVIGEDTIENTVSGHRATRIK